MSFFIPDIPEIEIPGNLRITTLMFVQPSDISVKFVSEFKTSFTEVEHFVYCLSNKDPDKALAFGMTDVYDELSDLTKSLKASDST